METANLLYNVLTAIVFGLLGMPLTGWLKEKLGWDDLKAWFLSAAVAVLLALLQLYGSGYFLETPITWANFSLIFFAVWEVAKGLFKVLKYGQEMVK